MGKCSQKLDPLTLFSLDPDSSARILLIFGVIEVLPNKGLGKGFLNKYVCIYLTKLFTPNRYSPDSLLENPIRDIERQEPTDCLQGHHS
ncbi:hypothetical protein E2C01_057015 [Portunus trituberculatus]|uniref:Uncharacterized protein n=1 Tax=Portunus trituberculatus TaxID=210409 RepID=A0A5B7H268_PORTR|nr:hypothetical protein [Portunus trituberculatus]